MKQKLGPSEDGKDDNLLLVFDIRGCYGLTFKKSLTLQNILHILVTKCFGNIMKIRSCEVRGYVHCYLALAQSTSAYVCV